MRRHAPERPNTTLGKLSGRRRPLGRKLNLPIPADLRNLPLAWGRFGLGFSTEASDMPRIKNCKHCLLSITGNWIESLWGGFPLDREDEHLRELWNKGF